MRLFPLLLALTVACESTESAPEAWSAETPLAAPPVGDLDLEATALSRGLPFTLTATAGPGDRVTFLASVRGPDGVLCPDPLGGACVDVESPLILGSATADGDGIATFERTVPADLGADTVWFQAAVADGADSSVSPVVVAPLEEGGLFEPETVQISMDIELDFSGPSAGLACLFAGVCDCDATYQGDGVLLERDGDRWTFDGSWVQVTSSCSDGVGLEGEVWAPDDGLAYHSLILTGGDRLTSWVAHDAPDDFSAGASDNQWVVEDLDELWDGGPIRFGGETSEEELGVTATVISNVTITFE